MARESAVRQGRSPHTSLRHPGRERPEQNPCHLDAAFGSRRIDLAKPLAEHRTHQGFVTDDLRLLIGKDGGAVDVAVVMVGVDDRLDGFLVEDVVQLGIEGILGGLARRNALPWIDDNQAVAPSISVGLSRLYPRAT
jgi:hypothetical protein